MADITVTRWYLEMSSPRALRGERVDDPTLRLERADPCPVILYRKLYGEVGGAHLWTDRLQWSDAQLMEYLQRRDIEVWVLFDESDAAGYFELKRDPDGSTEIVYFGLRPRWIGRGLGKHLLTAAVEEAWKKGTRRVWLHTCSLDSPHALPNYLARGFREFNREQYVKTVAGDGPTGGGASSAARAGVSPDRS